MCVAVNTPEGVSSSASGRTTASTGGTTPTLLPAFAIVTRPPPASIAPKPANTGAPGYLPEPPRISTRPNVPLCDLSGLAGNRCATWAGIALHVPPSSANVRPSSRRTPPGIPISSSTTRPAFAAPSPITVPTLAGPVAKVCVAWNATGSAAPVSASTPDGTSIAIRNCPACARNLSQTSRMARTAPRARPEAPMPSRPSSTMSDAPSQSARRFGIISGSSAKATSTRPVKSGSLIHARCGSPARDCVRHRRTPHPQERAR